MFLHFSKSGNFQLFNFNIFFSEHPALHHHNQKAQPSLKGLHIRICSNVHVLIHLSLVICKQLSLGCIFKPIKCLRTLSPLYGPLSLSPHFCRLCVRELPKVHNVLTLNTEFPCYKNNVILDSFIYITTNEYQTIPFP